MTLLPEPVIQPSPTLPVPPLICQPNLPMFLQALANALKYSGWFSELLALGGLGWKSEGESTLSFIRFVD